MRIRSIFVSTVLAALSLLFGLVVPAPAGAVCPSRPQEMRAPIGRSVLRPTGCPIEGTVLTNGQVGVTIPGRGLGVDAIGTMNDGTESTLSVAVAADGVATITSQPAAARPQPAATYVASQGKNPCKSPCKDACRDDAFSTADTPWRIDTSAGPYEWMFNASTTPDNDITQKQAIEAVNKAANALMTSKNNCDMSDRVDLDMTYEGETSLRSTVDARGTCLASDGVSVVDFGQISIPGLTCTYTQITSSAPLPVIEADTQLAETFPVGSSLGRWTSDPSSPACGFNLRFDMAGIMVHEFGHHVGLSHVDMIHGNQTMSVFGLPNCSKAYRTLGKGDVKGLRSLY